MTKVKMPDPVAWGIYNPTLRSYELSKTKVEMEYHNDGTVAYGVVPFITITQAEAYKDACVRGALEALAKIARDRYEIALSSRYNCDDGECPDTWEATAVAMAYSYQTMETHIRALIPSTPA